MSQLFSGKDMFQYNLHNINALGVCKKGTHPRRCRVRKILHALYFAYPNKITVALIWNNSI